MGNLFGRKRQTRVTEQDKAVLVRAGTGEGVVGMAGCGCPPEVQGASLASDPAGLPFLRGITSKAEKEATFVLPLTSSPSFSTFFPLPSPFKKSLCVCV